MTTTSETTFKRRYRPGVCQDCGNHRNVTLVKWWVSGWAQRYCADCVRQYRSQLLTPGNLSDPYWTRRINQAPSSGPQGKDEK